MKSRGFTLIESITALVLFIMGVTLAWFGLGRFYATDHRIRLRESAYEALSAEAEALRGSRKPISDTQFVILCAGDTLRIRRTVLDSARCDSLSRPYALEMDSQLRQAWSQRPLEVLLEESKTHSRLFLVLPDYRWY